MPEPAQLAVFVVASAILGITPGPDIIYVITRGAAQGPRVGVAAAAGLSTGIIGHTMLCVAGISAVLAASAPAFTVIKLLGAAYLVYLGGPHVADPRIAPICRAMARGGRWRRSFANRSS